MSDAGRPLLEWFTSWPLKEEFDSMSGEKDILSEPEIAVDEVVEDIVHELIIRFVYRSCVSVWGSSQRPMVMEEWTKQD